MTTRLGYQASQITAKLAGLLANIYTGFMFCLFLFFSPCNRFTRINSLQEGRLTVYKNPYLFFSFSSAVFTLLSLQPKQTELLPSLPSPPLFQTRETQSNPKLGGFSSHLVDTNRIFTSFWGRRLVGS